MTGSATTITVVIPPALRACCDGVAELAVPVAASPPTVRAVLAALERHHPALHVRVCDETGAVRRHINVFVNASHVRDRDGLDTALSPGDVVTILPAVSGG